MIKITAESDTKPSLIAVKEIRKRFTKGLRAGMFEIGRESVKQMRLFIKRPPKTGRLYRIFGRLHRASAPGESPARLTGQLQKTMGYKVRGLEQVEFGDRELYGKFLEFGTKRMKPRPHVIRTANKKRKDVERSLINNVHKALNAS